MTNQTKTDRLEGIHAYPLSWPEGQKRTRRPASAAFKTRFAVARDGVIRGLGLMGIGDWNVILSSNVELRRDGLPYAGRSEPHDPGIAVYWIKKNGDRMVIACDRWNRVRDNLQSINKTIEAIRGIGRWGTGDMMEQAFNGFKQLGDGTPQEPNWREVLGYERDVSALAVDVDEIRGRFRRLAREVHPDRGGGDEAMARLNAAHEAAFSEINKATQGVR